MTFERGFWKTPATAPGRSARLGASASLAAVLLLTAACSEPVAQDLVPEARISVDRRTGPVPHTVELRGEAVDGDAPVTLAWTLGDGTESTDPTVRHTYDLPGRYEVVLTVVDADGDRDEDRLEIDVTPLPLDIGISAAPRAGPHPLEVSFGAFVSGGLAPFSQEWTFGDGATHGGDDPVHVYQTPGSYEARLTVTDGTGASAEDTVRIEVTADRQPTLQASADPLAGVVPLTVRFSASGQGGDGTLSYLWDFGDGTSAVGRTASHTYSADGVYTARVTLSDEDGDTDTAAFEIAARSPYVDLAISDLQVEPIGDHVRFEVTVTNEGSVPAAAPRLDLYGHRSAAPGAGDLGEPLDLADLAPGESRTITGFVREAVGSWDAWVQVDADERFAEPDEADNVAGPVQYEVVAPLVINEVRYRDGSYVSNACFVELYGPPGLSLDGMRLVGVDGYGGSDYQAVVLDGHTIPYNRFFVVGTDNVSAADLVTSADWANGPDSIQLRLDGRVLDAVAYGSFGAGDHPAGEGSPAPEQPNANSIGRYPDGNDSDDNARDFSVLTLSPGAANP